MSDSIASKTSILIIGLGSIGERHLRCFQETGLVTVAACERNADLGQSVASRYGCKFYSSLEEALERGHFDAAVICTPANTHIPIAAQCVGHCLHVLIEKPLAVSLDGIGDLQQMAESSRRTIRVAYPGRAIPSLLALKALLGEGQLGSVRHVSVVSGQNFPSLRPAYRTIYYTKHETGGGSIQDALTHHFHTIEWLVGPIDRVFASAAHQVLEGVEVEDTVNMTAVLADGALASFAFNHFQAPNETTITLNGTNGSARFEMHAQRLGLFHLGDPGWTWTEYPLEKFDQIFVQQARNFLDAIAGKDTPLATLDDALQTLKVNRAALESARTHHEVVLA